MLHLLTNYTSHESQILEFTIGCSVKFKNIKNLMNVSNHCKLGVDWHKISALASFFQTDPLHNRLTPPTSVPFWRIPLNYV